MAKKRITIKELEEKEADIPKYERVISNLKNNIQSYNLAWNDFCPNIKLNISEVGVGYQLTLAKQPKSCKCCDE